MTEEQREQYRKEENERWEKTKARLDEEWKRCEEEMKHYDPVVTDRTEIQQQLESSTSVFILEYSKSSRAKCKAKFCLPRELWGSKIESRYRLNLKDTTGERTGELPHWKRKITVRHHLRWNAKFV